MTIVRILVILLKILVKGVSVVTLLRELRERSRLSLSDLCRARNLSLSALSQAERRKAVPSKRIRRELARFYREDEARLFDDEGLARIA